MSAIKSARRARQAQHIEPDLVTDGVTGSVMPNPNAADVEVPEEVLDGN